MRRRPEWGDTQLSHESLEVPIEAPAPPRIDVGSDYSLSAT